jgi:Protein of unknown function (DUF1822)
MNQLADVSSLCIPLDATAHELAKQFAQIHWDRPRKAAQVYRNTLCVCAVYDYLAQNGIAVDLATSDSWTALEQAMSDVADLHVEGLGRVECRPVLPQAKVLEIAEFWDDRLAYIAVQLDNGGAEATQATILGFVTQPQQVTIPLTELRSVAELLNLLTPSVNPSVIPQVARLRHWFQGTCDAGWEAIETILNPTGRNYTYAFRDQNHSARRAKLLDFGLRLSQLSVALLVGLEPCADDEVVVRVQVHPAGTATQLPAHLTLTLCSDAGDRIQQEISRADDFMMQLRRFRVPIGEQFQVQVTYEEMTVTEQFIV